MASIFFLFWIKTVVGWSCCFKVKIHRHWYTPFEIIGNARTIFNKSFFVCQLLQKTFHNNNTQRHTHAIIFRCLCKNFCMILMYLQSSNTDFLFWWFYWLINYIDWFEFFSQFFTVFDRNYVKIIIFFVYTTR